MQHGNFGKKSSALIGLHNWDEFDYLVPGIDRLIPKARLEPGKATLDAIAALADTMSFESQDANVPAPYTYLGQFIDHDITLTVPSGRLDPDAEIQKPTFEPIPPELVPRLLRNRRTSAFDLDSLYGAQPLPGEEDLAVPFRGDKFVLGQVSPSGNRPAGKADDNDLPRVAKGKPLARRARIGDPRNDENLIIAQLHLAFLKFHNAVVDEGHDFDAARKLVTQHYQWLVVTDFLPRVCDPAVVRAVLSRGNRLYKPRRGEKYMPLEFAVAAYRFGHSMVRSTYDFNLNFKKGGGVVGEASLAALFEFTGLNGKFRGLDTLPENWIAQWEMLLADRTLQIDPSLTPFLHQLPGQTVDVMKMLSRRNLLKGVLFSLPTGQALAEAVVPPALRMTPEEILDACNPEAPASGKSQRQVVEEHGLHRRTPLWLYLLAEAKAKCGGNHLGPLGSVIVAETIIGLIRASRRSILREAFVPTMGQRVGTFDLQDLLLKAGVLDARVA